MKKKHRDGEVDEHPLMSDSQNRETPEVETDAECAGRKHSIGSAFAAASAAASAAAYAPLRSIEEVRDFYHRIYPHVRSRGGSKRIIALYHRATKVNDGFPDGTPPGSPSSSSSRGSGSGENDVESDE